MYYRMSQCNTGRPNVLCTQTCNLSLDTHSTLQQVELFAMDSPGSTELLSLPSRPLPTATVVVGGHHMILGEH